MRAFFVSDGDQNHAVVTADDEETAKHLFVTHVGGQFMTDAGMDEDFLESLTAKMLPAVAVIVDEPEFLAQLNW